MGFSWISLLVAAITGGIVGLIAPIVSELGNKYGEGLRDLQNPLAPDVNKTRLCSILIDLYSQVLQLPVEQSGPVVRYMLGQGAK